MSSPLRPYDEAAFENFCSDLVADGFSPIPGTHRRRWTGPLRPCLDGLAPSNRMEVHFYDGWPMRYAHIVVPGWHGEHASNGTLCLWAEDDPAQFAGLTLATLWQRLEEWAAAHRSGFERRDQGLDGYLLFAPRNDYVAEIELADLVRHGTNGMRKTVWGDRQGMSIQISSNDLLPLRGMLYLRSPIETIPANLAELRACLTRDQRGDFDRGIGERVAAPLNSPSGGYDFVVLTWPRHDSEFDALVVGFSGPGEAPAASGYITAPSDLESRRRRAGPDADALSGKRVLIAGLGAVGGHVASCLAASGVGYIRMHDSDVLKTVNLVRHVSRRHAIGYPKPWGLAVDIDERAPWCRCEARELDLSHDPEELATQVAGFDLVIDCTGRFSITAALTYVCNQLHVPLLSVALHHHGSVVHIARQSPTDTPIALRRSESHYVQIPPEVSEPETLGFLELGCTARIHNAPPAAVLRSAAQTCATAIDELTGRRELPAEQVEVLRPLEQPPFNRIGPVLNASDSTEYRHADEHR